MRRHLFLLKELVKRDFHGRYAGSVLGFVWSFVQPLWLLVLFTFVFATVMKVPLVGQRTDNFGVFLFAGLLPWMAIQEGIQRGASAITDNAELVKKLTFPSEILVVAVVLAAMLHELIGLAVFLVVLAAMGELSYGSLPLLVPVLALQLALTFGLAAMMAALNVFFRDVGQILGMFMNGWFYLTPVVYPLSLVPESFRPLIEANPLTPLVQLYRQALLGGGSAAEGAVPDGTWLLAIVATILLFTGWRVYRRLKPTFVDEI